LWWSLAYYQRELHEAIDQSNSEGLEAIDRNGNTIGDVGLFELAYNIRWKRTDYEDCIDERDFQAF
jgi:hypothetical protein